MFRNTLFRWTTRLLLPHLADQMAREGAFRLVEPGDVSMDPDRAIVVEDRGADTTLFCFSGLAVLVAGLCSSEFSKLLSAAGERRFNFVFVRDFRRSAYHVAPDGTVNGLEFYERKVRELLAGLGTRCNVALGDSVGGSAAFYFGARCGMDKIIGFSPAFPETVFTAPGAQVRTYLNIKQAVTEPSAYIETVLVTISAYWILRQVRRLLDGRPRWDVMQTYRTQPRRPAATVFYGARCGPDAYQASLLSDLPEVKLVPLPTGHHDCPAYLRHRGELAKAILDEVPIPAD